MFYNSSKINTFRELMNEIFYDWGFCEKNLYKRDDGVFICNKTAIGKDFLEYKTETHELAPGLYEKLEQFYNLLEEG